MLHRLRVAILPGFLLFLFDCCSGSPSELAIVKFRVSKEGCVLWRGSADDLPVFQRGRDEQHERSPRWSKRELFLANNLHRIHDLRKKKRKNLLLAMAG